MTREEFQTERTRIISEMLDNPDEYGIYPTTKCFEQLDALFDSLSLPPAEGAEKLKEMEELFNLEQQLDIPMKDRFHNSAKGKELFAAIQNKPHPTAEGAEEILEKHLNLQFKDTPEDWTVALIQFNQEKFIAAMQEYATLHAQRIAEKMVEERLMEELIGYDKFLSNTYWGISHIIKRDEAVDEYLKSRER
jgi:hypothetical protein